MTKYYVFAKFLLIIGINLSRVGHIDGYRGFNFDFIELVGQSQILKESDLSQYQIHTVKELEDAYREGYNYEKLIGLIMDKSQEQKLYILELINPSQKLYKMSKVVIVDGSR